jgi:ABC-type polysaccharide/polyol phosphate export permease
MYTTKSSGQKYKLAMIERYWELVSVLARRELKVRYRGSFLGIYWSLFNPVMMTGLYAVVFGSGFKKQYYNDSLWQYALAAFTGLTIIQFYNSSTSQALVSIVSNNSLLNKVKLPVSIFPVSVIVANIFQLLVGMLPLLITMTILLSPHPSTFINVIAITIPLLALIFISTGVGFLTSALYVFFRDLPFLYELVQFVILMSSPTFYPAEFVPAKIRQYLDLNPLYPVIESLRQVVLSGESPDPTLMFRSLLSGIIILAIGWICFNWLRPKFMDLL